MLHNCPHALGDNSNPIDGHRWSIDGLRWAHPWDWMESQYGWSMHNHAWRSMGRASMSNFYWTIFVAAKIWIISELQQYTSGCDFMGGYSYFWNKIYLPWTHFIELPALQCVFENILGKIFLASIWLSNFDFHAPITLEKKTTYLIFHLQTCCYFFIFIVYMYMNTWVPLSQNHCLQLYWEKHD